MQLPHIHLNGTSAQMLYNQYRASYLMVADALESMQQIETHGRDYYTINSDAINVAMAEHRERLAKLESVRDDLEALMQHCRKSQTLGD